LRWFTIKDATTPLFFLRDAQPAGIPTPFAGYVFDNITVRGTRPAAYRLRGWRCPSNPNVSLVKSMAA